MGFNSLEQTNQKLAQNPELSDHNKQVLEDFFRKIRSGGAGDAIVRDYSSRFNKLAEVVDFQLDNPTQRDLEEIVADFNQDNIKKNNGEKYSDYSKDKFWSTLSKFYRWFIKKQGKGYNEQVDGEDLLEDLEIKVDLSTDVDPDRKPTPKEVRKVANHANSLRDKAIILFGWATGARVGEIFDTEYSDQPLLWKDLKFHEDKLWVTLDGKTGEREIPVKTSMPVMKELWENTDAGPEDSVFVKKNRTYMCPRCPSEVNLASSNTNKEYKKYSCQSCDWKGPYGQVEKVFEPVTDDAVRRLLHRTIERAGLDGEFDINPHDFWRKSRAIYKTRVGYTEHQLRGFFGWSETSDAPKHYISLVKEDLEKALAEEFGEQVEYDNGYDEEALRPVVCVKCETLNEATTSICRSCGNGLNDQVEDMTKTSGPEGLQENLITVIADKLAQEDPAKDKDEIREMVEKKSVMELLSQ